MGLSNDERGWVMTCLSGIACVLGASIICVDILIRQFPGKQGFRIQDSDTFLSSSLSLSFGVMLFSALYSMLPSAKISLINGGFTPKQSSWILITCFLGGVVGIQVISRVIHGFIPTHAIDCDHSHDDDEEPKSHGHSPEDNHEHDQHSQARPDVASSRRRSSLPGHMVQDASGRGYQSRQSSYFTFSRQEETYAPAAETQDNHEHQQRRPSLQARVTNTFSQLTSGKTECDSNGSCYGYTDPCSHECFKNVNARGGFRAPRRTTSSMRKPNLSRIATTATMQHSEATPLLDDISEETRPQSYRIGQAPTRYFTANTEFANGPSESSSDTLDEAPTNATATLHKVSTNGTASTAQEQQGDTHHHHVPTNAFLSIGLQTSIAIALHKLPEGFITYATNHANPKLGVSVFLALFIHNITEGFAMALPLYLAINSRLKAMLISFVLGGLSQPIGAAVAAVWFHLAGQGDWAPSEGVYGAMFAVTAGIMASVALQLFSESLDLTHNRGLCMLGAFTGMGILGISSALTA